MKYTVTLNFYQNRDERGCEAYTRVDGREVGVDSFSEDAALLDLSYKLDCEVEDLEVIERFGSVF